MTATSARFVFPLQVKNMPKQIKGWQLYRWLTDEVKNMATVLPLVLRAAASVWGLFASILESVEIDGARSMICMAKRCEIAIGRAS